jgi:hypothetical protein
MSATSRKLRKQQESKVARATGIPTYLTKLGQDWYGMAPPPFKSPQQAQTWLVEKALAREAYHDNFRFGFVDDAAAMQAYEAILKKGCCGYADVRVVVGGRDALVGCNYGH